MLKSLNKLVYELDEKFNVAKCPPDIPFSRVVPREYEASGLDMGRYFYPEYLKKFNGLMLRNGDQVQKIYLAVFLSPEILDVILERGDRDALIFVHHPMEFESSGRGFLPLPEEYLKALQAFSLSVYAIHSPLDIHSEIATSQSIANQLNLIRQRRYNAYSIGFAGIVGELQMPVSFDDFLKALRRIFEINEIHFIKRTDTVHRVGVIAGGGADVAYIKESIALQCDTYLSGDYENKVRTENSIKKRQEFEKEKDDLNINLIECSHYATEKLVFIHELKTYFESVGYPCEFIPQKNPWK